MGKISMIQSKKEELSGSDFINASLKLNISGCIVIALIAAASIYDWEAQIKMALIVTTIIIVGMRAIGNAWLFWYKHKCEKALPEGLTLYRQ